MEFLSYISSGSLSYRPTYPQTSTVTTDTHDAADDKRHDEEFRKRDEEIRNARLKLRADLLDAVYRITGRPPSLDASPKELASIARKSESFDYWGALAELARIEGEARALAQAREEMAAASRALDGERRQDELRRRMRQEEEALLLLLLN